VTSRPHFSASRQLRPKVRRPSVFRIQRRASCPDPTVLNHWFCVFDGRCLPKAGTGTTLINSERTSPRFRSKQGGQAGACGRGTTDSTLGSQYRSPCFWALRAEGFQFRGDWHAVAQGQCDKRRAAIPIFCVPVWIDVVSLGNLWRPGFAVAIATAKKKTTLRPSAESLFPFTGRFFLCFCD